MDDIRDLREQFFSLREEIREAVEELAALRGGDYWDVWMPQVVPSKQVLPVPRLELVVDQLGPLRVSFCYRLVTRDMGDRIVAYTLGYATQEGTVYGKFRPGLASDESSAHILHDAEHLGLPAFWVCRDVQLRLTDEPREPKMTRA